MAWRFQTILRSRRACLDNHNKQNQTRRWLQAVRLKWVKNKGLDHVVNRDTSIKAACAIKDMILTHPGQSLPATTVQRRQKRELELSICALRFMRRFPTLFEEFRGPRYESVPWFRLTPQAAMLDNAERSLCSSPDLELDSAQRLCRLLMMTSSKRLPVRDLKPWAWDLGLLCNFESALLSKYPEYLRIQNVPGLGPVVRLAEWRPEMAVSVLQRNRSCGKDVFCYDDFVKEGALAYDLSFPRGYDLMNKVKAWRAEWQRLPYVSPYEDASRLDPESDVMEKRCVGVLHELLHLTVHKRAKRDNIRAFREELLLPHNFTKIFNRYLGIFYLSLKCKMVTATLREAYKSAKLVDSHPLVAIREKYFYMMRMGVLYRKGGIQRINTRHDRRPLWPEEMDMDSDDDDEQEEDAFTEEEKDDV